MKCVWCQNEIVQGDEGVAYVRRNEQVICHPCVKRLAVIVDSHEQNLAAAEPSLAADD